LEHVARDDYRDSAKDVEVFGWKVCHTHAGRTAGKAGRELHSELFGPDAQVEAARQAPPNAPELMIVGGDGSRYPTNEADRPRKAEDAPPEDRGWRENKVGVVARALPGKIEKDGSDTAPTELVKTCVATTRGIQEFGRDLRTEAERRGVKRAREVVFVSDNGHGMPEMARREFPEAHCVTDFYHVAKRLAAVAALVEGEGEAAKKRRRRLFRGLRSLLWHGKLKALRRRLVRYATRLAPRPQALSELDSDPAARSLWEHAMYVEKHTETMNYPEYRRKGWPVGSGTVESACGLIGERVKHARMRWTRRLADAIHAIKAAIMSEDGRWEKRWPPPVPVLETPAFATAA
jgi:hypothetical protein